MDPNTTLIEAIARAISNERAVAYQSMGLNWATWDGLPEATKGIERQAVRAALNAIRSSGMVVVKADAITGAFINGFKSSAEGWNGEHPMGPKVDAWLAHEADEYIRFEAEAARQASTQEDEQA